MTLHSDVFGSHVVMIDNSKMNHRPNAHQLGLVVLVVLWGLAGQSLIANKPTVQLEEFGRVPMYMAGIISLWLLFAYTAAGLRGRDLSVRSLIDPLPWTARRFGIYALTAVGMFFIWGLFSGALGLSGKVRRPVAEKALRQKEESASQRNVVNSLPPSLGKREV